MRRALLLTALLLATSLSGCTWFTELVSDLSRPDLRVQRTDLGAANEHGFITDTRFQVIVDHAEAYEVSIEAEASDGRTLRAEGLSSSGEPVVLELEDGTWRVSYTVAGHHWETFKGVRVDATPPSLQGLERIGDADGGAYTIGSGLQVTDDVTVRIEDFDGNLIATGVPHTVTGLESGLHGFSLTLTDPAGNQATATIQVRAGDAAALPEGQHTFGIVARYTNEVRIWDLSALDSYLTPSQARGQVDAGYVGSGFGITPDDDVVQAAVQEALQGHEDTTAEIAWSLYRWLFDNLEYDDARLSSSTLMLPRDVIQDSEDPDDKDELDNASGEPVKGGDGLVDSGSGNGVKGGVCRSLAGTYVSMLRAAGVPARLVSGYLAGNVDGFHAWVEVYVGQVGDNPSPWLPVDVSPVDGLWDDGNGGASKGLNVAMQAFGVSLPSYLALRDLPPAAEVSGWSTALSTSFSYRGSAPDVSFEKKVQVVGAQDTGVLCYDDATLERRVQSNSDTCGGMWILRDFVVFTERLIDYGVKVHSASSGTEIRAELSYPFAQSVLPDTVQYIHYTADDTDMRFENPVKDEATGKLRTTIKV